MGIRVHERTLDKYATKMRQIVTIDRSEIKK